MDFIDLQEQQKKIRIKLENNLKKVLDHGQYILGPEVKELEARLADFVGVKYCISASSGTDTLTIAMMALGIEPEDEVITTPFTYIATAETIKLLGAKPVFVDINESSFNIDPKKIESSITNKTKAIMPVGLFGQCSDMDAINAIARKHNLFVIEDAAQSFGATYKEKLSCNLSDVGSTSFFPAKPLGGYGDGGALFTNDQELANTMAQIRVHGQSEKYIHSIKGINGRLDTMQAAILLTKLEIFPEEILSRQEIARIYDEALKGYVITPTIMETNSSVYAQYTIRVKDREKLQLGLQKKGIPTAIYYPRPLHLQPVFSDLSYQEKDFPITEAISDQVISLPMHPYLDKTDQKYIIDAVIEEVS